MKVDNYPFTFVGILLLFVGWFAIISGIFGFFIAEDLLVFTLKLESMFLDTTFVPAEHLMLHMIVRIILGFIIVFIGNAFLARGIRENRWMHPRYSDFRRLR